MRRPGRRITVRHLMVAEAVLADYLGEYAALLRRDVDFLMPYPSTVRGRAGLRLPAECRPGGEAARLVFAPANLLDRLARPSR